MSTIYKRTNAGKAITLGGEVDLIFHRLTGAVVMVSLNPNGGQVLQQ